MAPLLEVRDLSVALRRRQGDLALVHGVSFDVAPGEALGLVGESGSGKSLTALAILGLLPRATFAVRGEVRFDGRDLLREPERALRAVRGRRIAMIFQEPMTALNPVLRVGEQIAEGLRHHRGLPAAAAQRRAVELLALVGVPDAGRRAQEYPHRLSGGLRQRVMIAAALACEPRLLVADEPTTALDVTIQAQILDLLRELRARLGLAVVLITHSLGVVAEFADRVAVMYAGRLVEEAAAGPLFADPRHPYTAGLLASIPPVDLDVPRLASIEGAVPAPEALPPGCAFAPRCAAARPVCATRPPALTAPTPARRVACWRETGYAPPEPGA